MRFLGRALFTILILGVVLWHGNTLWQRLSQYWLRITGPRVEQLQATRTRLTYTLDSGNWTVFAIPAGAKNLRISTNANLPNDLVAEPEAVWHYAVAYELIDAQGRVQTQHVYHHRSRVTRHAGQDTAETSPAAFYLDVPLEPTDMRNMVVDLAGFPDATRARFRLASKHESVTDVAMSIYARAPVAERKLGYLWRRLPREQKQNLAKGLVYSTDFLKQSEKHQLLQNRWQALGPKGIKGRDYQSRKLYVRKNIEPETTTEPTLPSGLLVDANHRGVIEIPIGGVDLRLDFLPLSPAHPPPDQNGIHLTWYGEQPHERSQHRVAWQDTNPRFERSFPPGILELRVSQGATVVQAFRRDEAGYAPWIIEPGYSRMYLVQPDQPVHFTVVHTHHRPTPFRIDVRHLPPPSDAAEPTIPSVTYELLTEQGEVVQSGRLNSTAAPSPYDYIPNLGTGVSVSDPSTAYFAIPPRAARIRFSLPSPPPATPILMAAWNRPADLIRELYIGHDRNEQLDDQRQWAWFPKRPENAQDLVTEQRSYVLHVQPRPPQDATDLPVDAYQVEQYRPEGMWRGRYLFLPRTPHPKTPLRPRALAVTFQPLARGREQHLVLGGLPQVRYLQPRLLYFSKSPQPQTVEILIDGTRQPHGPITGTQGEIALPTLSAGAHRIRVNSQPETRWYINHVMSGAPSHIKRLAYRFDASGLSFIYDRPRVTEETLSMRWHAPYGRWQPTHIRVRFTLSPTARRTPSPNWTFNERRYVLAPPAGPPIPVLNTTAVYVDQGQAFFLPIGHDVPAGRYRIRMHLEQGPPGYITLAKLNHGVFESRQFKGEKVPQYAQIQP